MPMIANVQTLMLSVLMAHVMQVIANVRMVNVWIANVKMVTAVKRVDVMEIVLIANVKDVIAVTRKTRHLILLTKFVQLVNAEKMDAIADSLDKVIKIKRRSRAFLFILKYFICDIIFL
jgi:hypothetical protein